MTQGPINVIALYFLTISFLFFVGSILGWTIEVLFRRFLSTNNPERKWINPGFLTGPYLPLYGFGLTALFLMSLFPYVGISSLSDLTWLKTIICILSMGVMMTLIEFIAGMIFIRKMHVKLWDYSDRKGNIKGVICPLFSFIWTVLAALYYFFVQPHILKLVLWYFNNIAFSFVVGVFFGVFFVDLGYSIHIVNIVRKFAADHDIIVRYEELKASIRTASEEAKEKAHFILAFKSEQPLLTQLESYREKLLANSRKVRQDLQDDLNEMKKNISSIGNKKS
ncbi:MAG: putative ABC transporter permease [Lachnospiraceae bacterium]|nr:putative ABC transporter permease [Lachnospiraceae bacterium]